MSNSLQIDSVLVNVWAGGTANLQKDSIFTATQFGPDYPTI